MFGTVVGDVAYDDNQGEVSVEASKGLDMSLGLFFVFDIKIEAYAEGTAELE